MKRINLLLKCKIISIVRIFIIVLLTWISWSCSRNTNLWENLKEKDCASYTFGRIETKRMLTEADKSALHKQGIIIQEFVLENQYLGSWKSKWNTENLDKTPVNALVKFKTQDKLASGMELSRFTEISNAVGSSMVLIQTIASVDSLELREYGEVLFHRDHFYRMLVPNKNLLDLLDYPCLRLLSIVKENYEPDSGKP